MSGVQIHTGDPIKPAEAAGVTLQTAYKPDEPVSQQASTTTVSSNGYTPARPGAVAATPTRIVAPSSGYSPPPPQPGAAPMAAPPATTAKATLPPPPKAGEKPMPPEYYAPVQSTPAQPAQPQPYPHQMSETLLGQASYGVPSSSTTSTTTAPSHPNHAAPTTLPPSAVSVGRASLEHPPGYVQNPFASDMTPDQRLAAEQRENESDTLPSLGYVDQPRKTSNAGFGEDESVWELAKKGLKKTGEEASKLHGRIWDSLGEK
ncbi:hypothetical protein P7C71_g512, partial [Lecanoromycetidae sp. Uapishka_2]